MKSLIFNFEIIFNTNRKWKSGFYFALLIFFIFFFNFEMLCIYFKYIKLKNKQIKNSFIK